MYHASVEKTEENKSQTVPHTLQSMIDAFNALNQVSQHILADANSLVNEVCVCVCRHVQDLNLAIILTFCQPAGADVSICMRSMWGWVVFVSMRPYHYTCSVA